MSNISKLVGLWYEVIGGLHHKDRDCHFGVTKTWSYCGEHKYGVDHSGYLLGDTHPEFKTYEDAETYLGKLIKDGIVDWVDCGDSNIPFDRRREIQEEIRNL